MARDNMSEQDACGMSASIYRPLSDADIRKIADEAFRVLEKGGMLVHSDEARQALVAAGAEPDTEGHLVRLPRSLVEDAIASNPSTVVLCSRNGNTDVVLEKDLVHFGTGGTALYVLDPDSGQRRPATNQDVILNGRLVEILDNIHVFTINVFPNEIETKHDIDVNRFFHALDNTRKHVMGGVYSLEGCRKVVEMATMIAGSLDALRERPFVSFITLIISPFMVDRHYGDMTCYFARQGLPIVVPTEPVCTTTSPVTLAANVLTHVAETLGGIALVQSVNRGAPGICGSVGSISNLRTLEFVGGAIERGIINAAVAQMAQHFELPLYSTAGTTDSKAVDVQAAYESAMTSLLVAMSGANYIHDIAGLMEADLTVSYEKLVVDNEILGMCRRVLQGIEVNDETLAADLMIEKGPGAHFIAEMHTRRHMRTEFFMPELANREKRESLAPGSDAFSRARQVVADLQGKERTSCLPADARERVISAFPEIRNTLLA